MTGTLYIDGIDVFAQYGVFVHEQGYNDMISYPPLKSIEYNDWPDEDGIEADLTAPRLDAKHFKITFGCTRHPSSEQFINLLSDGSYHEFDFKMIGIVRKLRLDSQSAKQSLFSLEKFELQFFDDFPLDGYKYQPPISLPSVRQCGYELDGKDLSEYGVRILAGTDDEITKAPAVKKNLLVNLKRENGVFYDDEQVVFQAKDVALKCFIHEEIEIFWQNYNALLHDLVKPDERIFYFDKRTEEFPCYYKNSSVTEFAVSNGRIWCKFNLILTFTSFRINEIDYLLAAEDGALFITENGDYYFDMGYYGNQ